MRPENLLTIYGSHDASITFIDKYSQLRVYEYERFVKKRYAMYSSRFDKRIDLGTCEEDRRKFLTLIKTNLKSQDIQKILYGELTDSDIELLREYFPNAEFELVGHHYSHACSGYFPSQFADAIIFSVDGGGRDNDMVSFTKVYHGKNNNITILDTPNIDLGNPYSGIGYLVSEVTPSPEPESCIHALSYAGKLMGLCAYGNVRNEWIHPMIEYYQHKDLPRLCHALGIKFGYNTLSGQDSYDIAATSQFAFEHHMLLIITPYLNNELKNVVLVGGCALNVLFNQRLSEILDNTLNVSLYVPPNPNDCGLSYGMFLSQFSELATKEVCYSGIEILDFAHIKGLLSSYSTEMFTYKRVVELLKQGKILGIIDDNSEVGPRALGNRSIICDPSIDNMKDILNAKVKFREWFRPFAPVCRIEDSNEYFDYVYESLYMSYAPKVKTEYIRPLRAITHVDNTARLQTVSRDSPGVFYNILTELHNQGHIPVILNTSFNIKGKPILTTIEDALYVLDNTEMDYVITNNYIITKKNL